MKMHSAELTAVWLTIAAMGCSISDPCDPGYYADHGGCYLQDAGLGGDPDDASAAAADGGQARGNGKFGTPCSDNSSCGGIAPVCGAPMFPVCTAINCLETDGPSCPTGWTCLDVTKYSPDPGVTSACVKL